MDYCRQRRAVFLAAALVALASLGACGGGDSGGGTGSRLTCSDFTFQEDAQAALGSNQQLDGDNDGIACESLPHRPSAPSNPTPPNAALAEGLYTGTITGSATSTRFEMLALENGDVWALYGNMNGAAFLVNGFVQGPTSRSGTSFSSTSVKDFGFNPAVAGSTSGTITSSSVSGTLTSNGATVSFAGTAPATSAYTYNTPAVLSQITGAWSLTGLDGSVTSVNIASSGSFTGTNAGCSISGSIAPRASGKNVFDVTVASGAAPCVAPGSVSTGIAVTYLIPSSGSRELVIAGVNSGRTAGNAFFGVR